MRNKEKLALQAIAACKDHPFNQGIQITLEKQSRLKAARKFIKQQIKP